MSEILEQLLIDAYVARRHQLVTEHDLRSAIERGCRSADTNQGQRDDSQASLVDLLVQDGSLSELDAEQLRGLVRSFRHNLQRLARELPDGGLATTGPPTEQRQMRQQPADGEEPDDPYATALPGQSPSASGDDAMAESGEERYEKSTPHAEGGLGRVWIASDRQLNRRVALKEIQPTLAGNPDHRARFLREATITSILQHPGVVPVYGLGRDAAGHPFYAMRFIEGVTLRESIDDLFADAPEHPYRDTAWRGMLRRLIGRLIDVCNTVAYAHSRGIVHRDLKPSNILLGDFGETLVVDWGLAKDVAATDTRPDSQASAADHQSGENPGVSRTGSSSDALTRLGAVVGTPAYMSPEQSAGSDQVNYASDIYSLGTTLYHLLTGRPPEFTADDNARPADPAAADADVPAPLAAICTRATQITPSQRYPSAEAMADDLRAWLEDLPVASYQESRRERAARWTRAHPTFVSTMVVAGFLLAVGAIVTLSARQRYQLELLQQRQQRSQLVIAHRQQVRTAVDTAIASARAELRNGRFEAALEFLIGAKEQLQEEPEFEATRSQLDAMVDRTTRLLDFYQYLDQAERWVFVDSSRRSGVLLQRAVDRVHGFQQVEWWTVLPDADLNPVQQHELRRDVYRAMFLLAAMRLKETIAGQLDPIAMLTLSSEQARRSNDAALLLFDSLDAYRSSQGSEVGRDFAENRQQWLARVMQGLALGRPVIRWQARNQSDLYVMGAALQYLLINKESEELLPFETVLGIADVEAESAAMLTQASEIRPDHYWTQLVRAFFEFERGEVGAAWRSYSHAIALGDSPWLAQTFFGTDLREHALQLDGDDPERTRLLKQSARMLESAVDLNPAAQAAHFSRGQTLTATMVDSREVTAAFLQALAFQEPLKYIQDATVEEIDRAGLVNIQEWCADAMTKGWSSADLPACVAWAEWMLGNLEAAERAAEQALEVDARQAQALWVKARLLSARGETSSAGELLSQVLVQWPSFHAQYAQGQNLMRSGEHAGALQAFEKASRSAAADWQRLRAHVGMTEAVMRASDSRRIEFVRTTTELATTERLEGLLTLAEQLDQPFVANHLRRHHNQMLPITQFASDTAVRAAPLINGGFELGIMVGWSDALQDRDRLSWNRYQGHVATASVVRDRSHGGTRSLRIEGSAAGRQDGYSELAQTFPVVPGATYRLTLRAAARDAREDAVQVMIGDQVCLTLPGGSYSWQPFEATVTVDHQETVLRVRNRGAGTFWLDDLVLVRPQESDALANSEPEENELQASLPGS